MNIEKNEKLKKILNSIKTGNKEHENKKMKTAKKGREKENRNRLVK